MEIKLHILSELSEGLLESVPRSQFKAVRRLPHIHKALSKYLKQHSHLLATTEHTYVEVLEGIYNPASIQVALSKLCLEAQDYESKKRQEKSPKNTVEQFIEYKREIVNEALDELCEGPMKKEKTDTQGRVTGFWQDTRKRIVESRGLVRVTAPSPKRKTMCRITNSLPVSISGYAAAVSKLFHSKLSRSSFSLFRELRDLEIHRLDQERESLDLVWRLLDAQFSGIFNQEPEEVIPVILKNTTNFLEQMFIERVNEISYSSGKGFSVFNSVAFYCGEVLKTHNFSVVETDANQETYWAIAYFLFRAGYYQELIDYARSKRALGQFLGYFSNYLEHYSAVHGRVLDEILAELTAANTMDVFKKALFILLARTNVELDELQELSLEDYLWFKLKITHSIHPEHAEGLEHRIGNYEVLPLSHLQQSILEVGPAHFNDKTTVYCVALLSCLCYGEAVQYLANHEDYSAEAVHIAVGLNNEKILPGFFNQDSLFEHYEGILHVNYNLLLSQYLREYESFMPNEALMYISFMSNTQAIVDQTTELVTSYDNYQIILNSDTYIFATKFREVVEYPTYKLCIESVAAYAANQTHPEAIVLYDLIEEYPKVLECWMREITQLIHVAVKEWTHEYKYRTNLSEQRGSTEQINFVASKYPQMYNSYTRNRILEQYSSFYQSLHRLETILTFYSAVKSGHYKNSLQILASAQLIPVKPVTRVSEIIEKLRKSSSVVKEEMPDLVNATLQVLKLLHFKEDMRNDVKSVIHFFEEVCACVKGLSYGEKRLTEVIPSIVSFKEEFITLT